MELIEAIFRPFKLEEVKATLTQKGIHGATITEMWVHCHYKTNGSDFRGLAYGDGYIPRIKLEVVVDEEHRSKAIAAILHAANTGGIGDKNGDGMIFVSPVVDAIRIRTGEHGDPKHHHPHAHAHAHAA